VGEREDAGGARSQAGDRRSEDNGAIDAGFRAARPLLRPEETALRGHIAGDEAALGQCARTRRRRHLRHCRPIRGVGYRQRRGASRHEPTVKSKSDKFLNTDLEKILKEKGIQTVIVTGNSANGAVLYTGTGAALRGLKVVVLVDGLSANEPFEELLTVWQLAHGPGFGNLVTITKSDMIKF
jgi:hypothetical protein